MQSRISILPLIALILCFTSSSALAATITVNTVADENDTGNIVGNCSLREAIASANTNSAQGGCTTAGETAPVIDEIVFSISAGSTITLTVPAPIEITSNVNITGPSGLGVILDGNSPARTDRILIVQSGSTVAISQIDFINGSASNSSSLGAAGGAIHNSGTLTLLDSILRSNSIFSSVSGDSLRGGAIYNSGTLTVTDSSVGTNDILVNQSSTTDQNGMGGAIYNQGTLTIHSSTFSGNDVASPNNGVDPNTCRGGAIYNSNTGTVTISGNSRFSSNRASTELAGNSTSVAHGGAIYNSNNLTISGTATFSSNRTYASVAPSLGGAIYSDANLNLANAAFSDNVSDTGTTSAKGGALYLKETANLVNVIFFNNAATGDALGEGRAIYLDSSSSSNVLNVYHGTFVDTDINTVSAVLHNNNPGRFNVKNTVVSAGSFGCGGSPVTSLGNNLDAGATCGFSLQSINPLLGVSSNTFVSSDSFVPLLTSPLLEEGDCTGFSASSLPNADELLHDLQGDVRATDDTCDIGAIEFPSCGNGTVESPGSLLVNYSPGSIVTGVASFGAQSFEVAGNVILANDGVGTSTDACNSPLVNNVAGSIVLVDRGICSFTTKALNVQNAGGIGIIIADNSLGNAPPGLSGNNPSITIPALSIMRSAGDAMKAALAGTVTVQMRRQNEVCDDRNASPGDGCSATCTVETGYTCSGTAPSICSLVSCGNGTVDTGEQCDDNNTVDGDGCNFTCATETGYVCSGNPSVCLLDFGQACAANADCSSGFCDPNGNVCACDSNADCSGGQLCNVNASPNACVNPCGNGNFEGQEDCDDNNTNDGDGCSAICEVEPGYSCIRSPSVCTQILSPNPMCGNGTLEAGEQCDDGNTADGDGCSASCATENPSPGAVCGNGSFEGQEDCDDNNTNDGDGCSASCAVELGYACIGSPSACTPISNPSPNAVCGNGTLEVGEACDDSDTDNGDGCNATCSIESGYACNGTPSQCDLSAPAGNNNAGGGSGSGCSLQPERMISTQGMTWTFLLAAYVALLASYRQGARQ